MIEAILNKPARYVVIYRAAQIILLASLVSVLAGCTTSYRHISNPLVRNDGFDLVCGGVEFGDQFTVSADGCYNLAPSHGTLILIDAKYRWRR